MVQAGLPQEIPAEVLNFIYVCPYIFIRVSSQSNFNKFYRRLSMRFSKYSKKKFFPENRLWIFSGILSSKNVIERFLLEFPLKFPNLFSQNLHEGVPEKFLQVFFNKFLINFSWHSFKNIHRDSSDVPPEIHSVFF